MLAVVVLIVLVAFVFALLGEEEDEDDDDDDVSTGGCLVEGSGCGVLLLIKANGEDVDDCRRGMIAVGGLGERLWEDAGA